MIYLDNAATTNYKPDCVVKAVLRAMTELPYNPNRSGRAALQLQAEIEDLRGKIAATVNCRPDRAILTSGCTAGLNTAIIGTARRGHVLTTVTEHNSVLRTLAALNKKGVDVSFVPIDEQGNVIAEMAERMIRPDTYMLCVGNASNVTGKAQNLAPLGKFANEHGLIFVVDCAQSVGYLPIDMKRDNIDIAVFGAHKGLHGIQGAGAMCLSDNVIVRPTVFGGTGTDSHLIEQPTALPEGLEAGTLPCPALLGMSAALDWHKANNAQNVQHLRKYQRLLTDNLATIANVKVYSAYNDSGIVSFNIAKLDSNFVADVLQEKFDIAARGGLQCAPLMHKALGTFNQGVVRASVSCVTTSDDCYRLLYAVDYISRHVNDIL